MSNSQGIFPGAVPGFVVPGIGQVVLSPRVDRVMSRMRQTFPGIVVDTQNLPPDNEVPEHPLNLIFPLQGIFSPLSILLTP
jgi:hypothetical protein